MKFAVTPFKDKFQLPQHWTREVVIGFECHKIVANWTCYYLFFAQIHNRELNLSSYNGLAFKFAQQMCRPISVSAYDLLEISVVHGSI